MNNVTNQVSAIESALIQNDISKLTVDQRLSYYKSVCESVGLNYLTQPFAYITLNGKLTLYAKRDATDQLRKIHKVSITITAREKIDNVYVVTARAKDFEGREDESTGAVYIENLKGDALANAFLKAETKAKRRVTLSICGLGLLDETEVETIPDANVFQEQQKQIEIKPVEKPVEKVEEKETTTITKIKNEAPISLQHQKELFNMSSQKGIKPSDLQQEMLIRFKVEKTSSLKIWQFEELMNDINNMK